MTDTLVAEINRAGLHSLEVPDTFETDGSFVVELRNRGESTHVHLHLDDALSSIARIGATNHYVQGKSSREIRVEIDSPEAIERHGTLKIVTAHGAHTRYVTVDIDSTSREVEVDPDLGKPKGAESESPLATLDPLTVSAVGLGVVGIILAVAAVIAGDGLNIAFGVLALLAGLIAAGLATLR